MVTGNYFEMKCDKKVGPLLFLPLNIINTCYDIDVYPISEKVRPRALVVPFGVVPRMPRYLMGRATGNGVCTSLFTENLVNL